MVARGVILAAGMGSRLAPMTPFIPKEMLPIRGLPVIHHALTELAESGINEVMIVVSHGKESVVSYLTSPIRAKGSVAERLSAARDELLSRVRIVFAEQKQLLGTADAISLAEHFAADAPIAVLYPDDVLTVAGAFTDGVDATRALVREALHRGASAVLTSEVDGCVARDYGVLHVCEQGDVLRVDGIVEKPSDYDAPIAHILLGRMVLTPSAIRAIRLFDRTDSTGIVPVLSREASRGALIALPYHGRRYDVGSHEGYAATLRAVT